mmetsp:Transcript_33908/g.95410  ORF Transcript_33908/g.95410 Transcript_33908/m.95410 type:complete len:96 (-) Transcript_33908:116-403(-)|eukprot:CAMPEP_0119132158 /NCGR_PEP_ID=MMETSP1310-20130426/11645_1 /TAXON_ID=464262 /ORGANISM="Genus nov. species nov., Strain RCC2339" /LENGTH=95 /DNA_ID=CAMNT_0007122775 /DNA_START=86 /DNA_END=373 /DNA_ORIENTATION=+
MGGTKKFPYPKYVWSPTGGYWNDNPKGWKGNTRVAMGGLFLFCACLMKLSFSRQNHTLGYSGPVWSAKYAGQPAEKYQPSVTEGGRANTASSDML